MGNAAGPMAWRDAVEIGVRIGEALESIHRAGRCHGSVTPDHVLVSAPGEAMLSDPGTAAGPAATDPAGIAHAAPEILDGAPSGTASDVYGLASTVYALIAGQAPFWRAGDGTVLPIMIRIFWEPVPDLRPLGVPDPVCAVLERALAKSPADRHPSAAAFVEALTAAVGADGEAAPAPAVVEADPVVPVMGSGRSPSSRRRRSYVVAAAAAVVVAVTAGALALVPGGRDPADGRARDALATRPANDASAGGSSTETSAAGPITTAPSAPVAAPAPAPRTAPAPAASSLPRAEVPRLVPVPRPRTTTAPVPVPPPEPGPAPVPAPDPEPAPLPTISISGPDSLVEGQTAVAYSCTVRNAVSWYWIDADGNRFGKDLSTVFVDATTPGVTTLTVYAVNADGAARSVTKAYSVLPR